MTTTELPRIGVFLCKCERKISDVVNLTALESYAKTLPGVVHTESLEYACSDKSQDLLKKQVKRQKLQRVVLAACSPRLYESVFRRCLADAGLNPFFLEIANLREQVSWAHTADRAGATEKAKDLVRGAVYRATELEPINAVSYPVPPVALVIGGGVAGLQAALALADQNVDVHLVERTPALGGKAAQLGVVFPTESCGVCVPPRLCEMSRECLVKRGFVSDPHIHVHTLTEVTRFTGHLGNFRSTLHTQPRGVDEAKCITCSLCIDACPVAVPNELDTGLSTRKAIYLPYPQAVPRIPVVDFAHCTRCGKCVKVCPVNAVNLDEKEKDTDLTSGAVIVATGFDVFEPKGLFGYGQYRNVITNATLARILDPLGPTAGELQRPSDKTRPKHVGIIQCVGSRDPNHYAYCSRVCCMITLKLALTIKNHWPDTEIDVFYKDIRLMGKNYERYYLDCQRLGVRFHRIDIAAVSEAPGKGLTLTTVKREGKGEDTYHVDLLSLASALIPPKDSKALVQLLNLETDPYGFLAEFHKKLVPVDTGTEGIYLAGTCTGPRDIAESSFLGAAAASHAAIPLTQKALTEPQMKAVVDDTICIGCANCFGACPYHAVTMQNGVATVTDSECQACGICVVECPAHAIQLRNFRDKQISAQVDGLLANVEVAKQ
jgi:heterodisulfide reductase subunit A